jgi:hypothetical protein
VTSRVRLVAEGLACAFLAGPWEKAAMTARGRDALGIAPPSKGSTTTTHGYLPPFRLVGDLARVAHAQYSRPPRRDELVDVLRAQASLARTLAHEPELTVRRWSIDPIEVGTCAAALAHVSLPSLPDVPSLADFLALEPAKLEWLADLRGMNRRARDVPLSHYHCHWVAKRSGAHRLIEAPKPRLRAVQTRILREILDRVPPHDAAHGFRRGRSVRTYVDSHVGRDIVVRLDLADFFNSVTGRRVTALYEALGYPRSVARRLSGLGCVVTPTRVLSRLRETRPPTGLDPASREAYARDVSGLRRRLARPHLPQGAPTSPALANLTCQRLDLRLTALARAFDARYSRYADDLAFSGGTALARRPSELIALASGIARDEGFTVRGRKTRVMRASRRQLLGGVVVNAKPSIRRDQLERLEATLFNAVHRGPASQNRVGIPDFRAHLEGRVGWVAHVAPHRVARLQSLLGSIDWMR